jgi:hypothetical protein
MPDLLVGQLNTRLVIIDDLTVAVLGPLEGDDVHGYLVY